MELFYVENIASHVTLSAEESRHCIKVMRHRTGDIIYVFDGKGQLAEAKIIADDPRAVVVEVLSVKSDFGHVKYDLTVGMPILKKSERFEWFVEKATEIGIKTIVPLVTRYTEKAKLRFDRLKRVAIAAAKQSLHTVLPQIMPVMQFEQFVGLQAEQKFIALCHAQKKLYDSCQSGKSTIILIGPEGGFSTEEIDLAKENGFVPVKLTDSRLRAETAAIAAVTLISHKNL